MRLGLARAHWMIVALLPALFSRAAAQTPDPKPLVVHIEASIMRVTEPQSDSTTDFGTNVSRSPVGGLGFDLAGVFEVRDKWHFVFGVQHTSHATSDSPQDISVLQLFIEGRYMLQPGKRVQPYAFVRLGYVHTGNDMELFDDTGQLVNGHAVQTGPAAGLGAGVLITATKRFQYFAAAGAQYVSLSDIDFDGYHVGDSSLSGLSVLLRAGISINFGPDGNAMQFSSRR